MERESFEDEEVSDLLNHYYVCIKVDKEERPDIDAVYMTVCQALTGSGGWPLTIFMTPTQIPFYAATYIPKQNWYGRTGMMELLPEIFDLWKKDKKRLLEAGSHITDYLKKQEHVVNDRANPDKKLLNKAVSLLEDSYDSKYGGFGNAPKFPTPHNLLFLLHYYEQEKKPNVLSIVETTLTQMFRGGIFDHIGGGFSRYSTDEKWLVPHFEKMLYDNALLIYLYTACFQVTRKPLYEHIARQTLHYVMKELSDEAGGFYCGQDADSEGVEGKFYVFTPDEIEKILGKEEATTFCKWFSVTAKGNFEGKNILNLLNNTNYEEISETISKQCEKLYDYRLHRTKLHLDDKVLTSWNALMISALANAGSVLQDEAYLKRAIEAFTFIENHLVKDDGHLYLRWRKGESGIEGQLDDYAFYAWSLLELYDSTFDILYIKKAVEIARLMITLFYDEEKSGFYMYAKDSEQLISRPKELYDGAIPSGNSVAGLVLVRLAKLTADPIWMDYSEQQLTFLAGNNKDYPAAHTFSMLAMLKELYPSKELICVTSKNEILGNLSKIRTDLHQSNVTVLVKTKSNENDLSKIAPFTADYEVSKEHEETYYLCENFSCKAPVHTLEALQQLLAIP